MKDYKLAALAGFLTGIFLMPVLWNLGYENSYVVILIPFWIMLIIAFGVWLGRFLSKFLPIMFQLSKFAAVGFLNTAIDFGILNILSLVTGVTSGIETGWIKVPPTIIAASNSYVWNKLWVFQKVDNRGFFADVPKFALVTVLGMLSRSGTLVLFTTYISPMFGLNPGQWLNVGNVIATVVGLLVDFLGYKFLVFKKEK
jgi:putative flippase GtrA